MKWQICIRPRLTVPFRIAEVYEGLLIEARDEAMGLCAKAQVSVAFAAGHLSSFLGDSPDPFAFRALWLEGTKLSQGTAAWATFCGFNVLVVDEDVEEYCTGSLRVLSSKRFVTRAEPSDAALSEEILSRSGVIEEDRLFVVSERVTPCIEELLFDLPEGLILAFDAEVDGAASLLWHALRRLTVPSVARLAPIWQIGQGEWSWMDVYPFCGAVVKARELQDPKTAMGRSVWVAGQLLWRRLGRVLLEDTHRAAFGEL